MNFQVLLGEGASQETNFIVAPSWSSCLAYCEGTGLSFNGINSLPNMQVVLLDSGTTNCYQVTVSVNGVNVNYSVWSNTYATFNTWLDSLSETELKTLQFTNKLYVTV
jgi:hypothetical protein